MTARQGGLTISIGGIAKHSGFFAICVGYNG